MNIISKYIHSFSTFKKLHILMYENWLFEPLPPAESSASTAVHSPCRGSRGSADREGDNLRLLGHSLFETFVARRLYTYSPVLLHCWISLLEHPSPTSTYWQRSGRIVIWLGGFYQSSTAPGGQGQWTPIKTMHHFVCGAYGRVYTGLISEGGLNWRVSALGRFSAFLYSLAAVVF